MSIEVIDKSYIKILYIDFHGINDRNNISDMIKRINEIKKNENSTIALLINLELFKVSFGIMDDIVHSIKNNSSNTEKVAIYGINKKTLKIIRIIERFIRFSRMHRIFANKEEAIDWLESN